VAKEFAMSERTMRVTVCFGGERQDVAAKVGATVAELLEAMGRPGDSACYVGEVRVTANGEHKLGDGDVVAVSPKAQAGGR
jgi:molybdopterin converting factor small subunit